jgi:hypothetical protein
LQTLFGVGGEAGYGGQWPAIIWHDFFMKNFNSETPVAWPPVNNDGTAWNLVGKFLRPKPKPKHHGHTSGCHKHGRFKFCPTQNPTPPPPTPTPTPTFSATPTPSPTCHGGPAQCQSGSPTPTQGGATAAARAVMAGAAVGAPLGMLVIVVAGPALPLVRRLRPRRRTRGR